MKNLCATQVIFNELSRTKRLLNNAGHDMECSRLDTIVKLVALKLKSTSFPEQHINLLGQPSSPNNRTGTNNKQEEQKSKTNN